LTLRHLNGADRSAPALSVFHVSLPPGAAHVPLRHRRTGEWVYVVSGSAVAELDGARVPLKAGDYLFLPAGVWHAFTAGAGLCHYSAVLLLIIAVH